MGEGMVTNMEKKYQIDTAENKAFMQEIANDLLRFGQHFPSPGGSAWYLKEDGTPWEEKTKDTYETCRMAHVYTMGKFLGFEGSEALVDQALKALMGEAKDVKNGGWYSGITQNGQTVPGKLCYVHAFVILAASSALLIDRPMAKELLEEALKVYDKYYWDEAAGMARDTWDTQFQNLDDYRGVNSNMHSVEAFLSVADVTGNDLYRDRAGSIIEHVVRFAQENNWRIPEHYTKEWKPDLELNRDKLDDQFKPYGATPGHGIEWARLITQWATSMTEKKGKEWVDTYIDAAENLFNRAVADGWNADGAPGVVYTTDWNGKPCVHDRMHWTLAEAINTAAVLYRVTKKQAYADQFAVFMKYLDEVVLDHEHGSWYHQLDDHNHIKGTVWPGKPDVYHALQSMLIPYQRVDRSIACALKK